MGVDVFGNSGADTLNIGQGGQSQTPQGASLPSSVTSNPIVDALIQKLNAAQQTQKQVVLPPQMPPVHGTPGDVSGNFVNPSTVGGPAHNARVSLAQSIGGAVSQAINRHEDKEARDLSFDIQRMQSDMNTLNDPNATPQEKQLASQALNELTSDKAKMKKIQKALNIQFFGGEDKRTDVEKKAVSMATQATQQGGSQQQQPQKIGGQSPQQGGENLGVPANMQGLNPMARQIMSRLPTTTGLTPAAMATAELTKAGVIPSANDILKFASDQQYYKVMEDKVGAEQAAKFAKIQADTETKVNELQFKYEKEADENKRAQFKNEIQLAIAQGHLAISQERAGLAQDELNRRIAKDADDKDAKDQNRELQKIKTSATTIGKEITDLSKQQISAQKAVNSTYGWTDKGQQARQSLNDINTKLQEASKKQQQILQQLDGTASSIDTSTSTAPEGMTEEFNALINYYKKLSPSKSPAPNTNGTRQTL